MKKLVNVEYETKDGIDYFVLKTNSISIYVDKNKKTISGKDLFNNIYSDLSADNFFEVEVNCASLTDEDKKIFGSYVVKMFSLIDEEMKKQFRNCDGQTENSVSNNDNLEG